MSINKRFSIVATSASLFILSLTQPAFYIDRIDYAAWSNSFTLVAMGWLGALMGGGAALAWFANPLLMLSWVLLSNYSKASVYTSSIASVSAISFFTSERVISSEAPTYSIITEGLRKQN